MGHVNPRNRTFKELLDHYESHDQGHVFRFWDQLEPAGRARLLAQAAAIDVPAALRAHAASQRPVPKLDCAPPPVETVTTG